jgi:hypothetical protein
MVDKDMSKMLFKFLGLGIFFINHCAHAQECPQPLGNLDIQVNMNPIHYEYGYTSRQIESVKGNKNPNLLGLFNSDALINVQPSFKVTSLGKNYYCMTVSSLIVKVNIHPIIYIAKEAQQFSCTKQRVEQHELLHYQFEVNTASKAKPFINNLANSYFNQPFYVTNQDEVDKISSILKKKSSDFINAIGQHFENSSNPLHAKIDSRQNYEYESSFCSVQENATLHKLLNLKY